MRKTKSKTRSKDRTPDKVTTTDDQSIPPINVLLRTNIKKEQAEQVAIMQALLNSQPVAMIVQIVPGTQQVTAILLPPSDNPDLAYEAGAKLLQAALRVWTEQGLIARQVREQYAKDKKQSASEEKKKNE